MTMTQKGKSILQSGRNNGAVNFNLYENGNNQWSMELVGTSNFDAEYSDWACDEVFAAIHH